MKLMIKILLVFLPAIGLLVYFTHSKSPVGRATSAEHKAGKLTRINKLPSEVGESSGIIALPAQNRFLTHNDAGNGSELFELDEKGNLLSSYRLGVPNKDWEDITRDDQQNLYISDTGNNNNDRKDLVVYKVPLQHPEQVAAIHFAYEDQKDFPPHKKDRNFDSEAIFWHGSNLYLITKDRGSSETAKVYQVPDQPGNYKAKLVGKVKVNDKITGADISPDTHMVVLLSEGKLHLFQNLSDPSDFYDQKYQELKLPDTGQTEGVTFEDDSTLYITSEGGNLYRYVLQ